MWYIQNVIKVDLSKVYILDLHNVAFLGQFLAFIALLPSVLKSNAQSPQEKNRSP